MSRFYVACDLGTELGRVLLGTLHKDKLVISEVRRFANTPIREKDSIFWNIPQLYQDVLDGLRGVGAYEEPVDGISCTSWAGDYLLFDSDGSLITPAFHHGDPRTAAGSKKVLAHIDLETLYGETGLQPSSTNTLFQLASESSRRLRQAAHLLPISDGFNYLLGGVPRIEISQASQTQLYNPASNSWSQRLLDAVHTPAKLLPPLVSAGTELGPLRAEIAKETRLEEARILASCSHEVASALAGLPVAEGESWAFLRSGASTLLGTQPGVLLINDPIREMGLNNAIGYQNSVWLHKHTVGLSILDECQRSWKETDREIDADLLSHLAGSATPFESLIDPTDPRFLTPGEMPKKIQAFCKETGQAVPRRPGPIFRCILESLALLYRKQLRELEMISGSRFSRLFILGKCPHSLLNHFIANAVQLPTVIMGDDAAAIGNIVVQALTLGHIQSVELAREIVRNSIKTETIIPYATAWDAAFDRLFNLVPTETSE
ncbi:MAG TPA: FGGY family carbohydrate kinase [Candidatus Limnocylindrales bacterium]|jgi:rhamnulokinase|nr:FGGY family carbohydrate kinase [Candidatus Limnocylindrales bacterium]